MKPKLSFLGWQECGLRNPGRGLALFNDPTGSTITLATAVQRYPDGFEIDACCLMISCKEHGIGFVSECPGGFDTTTDMAEAWLFDADRPYNAQLAREMAKRLDLISCPDAVALPLSISDAVMLMRSRGIKGAEVGNFFARESVLR